MGETLCRFESGLRHLEKGLFVMINKIILAGFFVATAYAQSPDELYNNALEDLESGNISSAAANFNSAL